MKGKKKQGKESSSRQDDQPSSPSVVPPPLEWEENSMCLGPVLRDNDVPLVVKCDMKGIPAENVNFNFAQPLLLHTRRTVRKVVACSVLLLDRHASQSDASAAAAGAGGAGGGGGTVEWKVVGDRLLIPEDYKGWFAVLGSAEDDKAERVVPHFSRVGKLAMSKCERFLVGGKEPITAVQTPSPRHGTEGHTQSRMVSPGDVLKMGKLYVGETTVNVPKSRLLGSKTKTVVKEEKFLQCTDDDDRVLYLPIHSMGIFYTILAQGGATPRVPVMRMSDICARFRLPVTVKLLHGHMPATPCSFTGTLVLQDSQVENSVIGSTMVNLRNILLDIPVDTDLRFFLATNTPPLLASTAYRNAKSLCDDKVDTYMRNIKVAYYFNDDDDAMKGGEDTGPPAQGSLRRADSVASVSRVGEVEDPELFCPPETARAGSGQLSHTPDRKRSIQSPSIPGSTCNLRQDLTNELMESPKRAPPQSSRALPHPRRENLPPPPSAPGKKSPPQATPDGESPDQYMTMSSVAKLPSALPASPSGLNKESSSQSAADTEPADHYMTMSNVAKLPSVLSTPPSATGKASTPQSAADREPADQYMTMSSVIKQPSVLSTSPSGLSRDSAEDKGSAGPYMTMIGAVQRPAASRLASFPLANPLGPPPPPFKPARLKSAQDTDIYSPVWDGDTGQCPPEEHEEESTTEKPEPQKSGSTLLNPFPQLAAPFSRQKDRAQATAHRRSRLAFGDSFLTLSLNTDTGSTGTDTSPSVPAAARPLMVTTKPKSKSGSSQSAAQEQPYEVMRRADPRQPSLPQKASPLQSGSQVSGTRCLPLPALPPQEANNDSTTADYETMDNQAPSTESSLGGRGRHDSYTYYEGYDPAAAKNISRDKQEGVVHLGSGLTGGREGGSDTDKTAEEPGNIYENNVINLRVCDDSLSVSGSVSSSTSGSERGPSLDKTDGPTKASDRGAASKKPLLPPRKPLSRMDAVNKTSFESDSSGTDIVFPPLPLPRPPDKHGSPPPGRTCLSKKGGNSARPASPPRSAAGVTAHPRDKFRDSAITAISAHLRDRFRNSGVSSNLSSEDDLPLGATFANFRSACSDSGCVVESVDSRSVASALAARSDVSSLSVGSLCQTLQEEVGVMASTVAVLRREKVDGRLLLSLSEEELVDALPGVKKLDIKKILMFSSGWKPKV